MDSTGIREVIILGSPTRFIFVGGSRGAGKTTCSCALAVQVADERLSVLLVSVKSHYNISDIFEQEFTETPTLVNGFYNLFAMELAPTPPNNKFLMDEIFEGETVARRINQTLANQMFQSFHSYGDDVKFAEIFNIIKLRNYDFVVFDTAASIDTFGLWPFQVKTRSLKGHEGEILSKLQYVPKYKNTLFERFDFDKCSDELNGKLGAMMQNHPQLIGMGKTVFILVDTVHPLHILGNKILISRLARHWIRTKLIVNKLTSCNIPYHVGRENYIFDVNMNDVLCYFLEEFHVVKLPQRGRQLKGVADITSFSENLIIAYYKKPILQVLQKWRDSLDIFE